MCASVSDCVEIRCQDKASEDFEPSYVCVTVNCKVCRLARALHYL
jgi:hypothetical protein